LIKISYLALKFFNLILFVVVSIYEFFIMDLLMLIFLLVGVLLSVAFFTLLERKVMASSQRRKGPDVVGFWGILQPIADGLKLVIKESVIPYPASSFLFFVAALLPFVMAFSA
jgi:NADH:ubiquinone oxidoreductase subunit H